MDSIDFPQVLKLNRLNYTSVILNHIMNRKDLNMSDMGQKLYPLLARCRSILPEHLNQYCDALNFIVTALDRYGDLAESCSRSGAYHAQRINQLEQLKTLICTLEQDAELIEMFKSMHVPGTF